MLNLENAQKNALRGDYVILSAWLWLNARH